MPAENGKPAQLGPTVSQVSERMSLLVREEIELAKAEMVVKARSLARGTAAVVAGGTFGFFALIFALLTVAWGLDAVLVPGAGDIWIGFGITTGVLVFLALAAFFFAWRKLSVGPPTPKMAIDEAKKIRETVAATTEVGS